MSCTCKYVEVPWDQRGAGMLAGFDKDGNRVALKPIPSDEEVDAARYRWLRANAKEIVFPRDNPTIYDPTYEKPEELDRAIDARIEKDLSK